MSENEAAISPFERHNREIIADVDQDPLVIGDVLRTLGLSGPRIPAEELKGETFTILRAKPFVSSFDETKSAWFCVIKLPKDDQPYTTVLGGGAVVDILEAVAAMEYERPIQVTLEWVEGGRYGGYYQFA